MSTRTTELLQEILSMPPDERAELADDILASLEPADPGLVKLWAAEAEDRVAALNAVKLNQHQRTQSLMRLNDKEPRERYLRPLDTLR